MDATTNNTSSTSNSARQNFQELQDCLRELEVCQQRAREKFGGSLSSLREERWSLRTAGSSLKQATAQLKQLLAEFASECKNEWVSTCQQFLALLGRILGVYQTKVSSLEDSNALLEQKLRDSQRSVTILEDSACTLREKLKYREMALLGEEEEQIESLWGKSERKNQSERKTSELLSSEQKRVRISDLIAGYSQQSSVTSYHFNSCGFPGSEEEHEAHSLAVPQALVDITELINRRQGKAGSPAIPSQAVIEMSVIFSGEEEEDLSPIKDQQQFRKHSLRQKENVSQRNREYSKTSKATAFQGPIVKAKEALANYSSSSGAKLDELRKSLLQRKRSQHLL